MGFTGKVLFFPKALTLHKKKHQYILTLFRRISYLAPRNYSSIHWDFRNNAVITYKSLPIIAICECGFCNLDTYPLGFGLIAVAFYFSLTVRKAIRQRRWWSVLT